MVEGSPLHPRPVDLLSRNWLADFCDQMRLASSPFFFKESRELQPRVFVLRL